MTNEMQCLASSPHHLTTVMPPGLTHHRRARLYAGHPRLNDVSHSKTWMAGTSPAMTKRAKDADGRNIGVRKHAVLRTAMPVHDVEQNQLLNFTPVIASRLPCQIFSLSAFGMSMPSMMRSVSR